MGAIKDFLTLDHASLEDMTLDDLKAECAGWRVVTSMLPSDVLLWVSRLGEPFRVITRKYEGKAGILTNVVFGVESYSLELTEAGFDALHGQRIVESKVLEISHDAVLYVEDILDSQAFDEWATDEILAEQSLDVGVK